MPVVAADLLSPNGPVAPSLFPGEGANELGARLLVYINKGAGDPRVTSMPADLRDGLVINYALYQAFRDAHLLMVTKPLKVNVAEKGGHGFSNEQIKSLAASRDQYLAAFNNGLVIEATPSAPPKIPSTQAVSTDVRWG